MSGMTRNFELLGGPCDGELRPMGTADRDFAIRLGHCWHLYRLQPTDLGLMLVYEGALTPALPFGVLIAS